MLAYHRTGNDDYRDALLLRALPQISRCCEDFGLEAPRVKDVTMFILQKVSELLPEVPVRRFSAWLSTLAQRECINWLREEARHRQALKQARYLLLRWQGDSAADCRLEALDGALRQLPPAQWFCLRLYYYQGLSYAEIAAATHYPVAAVKSHLQNGRRRLRRLLEAQPVANK